MHSNTAMIATSGHCLIGNAGALLECKVAVVGCGGLGGSVEEMTLR